MLWRSYWFKRQSGQDRSGALNELVRLCFTDSELKQMVGKEIKEK